MKKENEHSSLVFALKSVCNIKNWLFPPSFSSFWPHLYALSRSIEEWKSSLLSQTSLKFLKISLFSVNQSTAFVKAIVALDKLGWRTCTSPQGITTFLSQPTYCSGTYTVTTCTRMHWNPSNLFWRETMDCFIPHVVHRPILTHRLEWIPVCFEQMEMEGSERTVRINKPPDLL